jgi:hypothetical protein
MVCTKLLNDEHMQLRAFAHWENEGGATALGHENSNLKVVLGTTATKKPPKLTDKK